MTEEYYNIIKGIDYPSYQDFMDNRFVESYFEPHVWQELCNYKMHSGLNSASTFVLGKHFLIGCEYKNEHVYNAETLNICLPKKNFERNVCVYPPQRLGVTAFLLLR